MISPIGMRWSISIGSYTHGMPCVTCGSKNVAVSEAMMNSTSPRMIERATEGHAVDCGDHRPPVVVGLRADAHHRIVDHQLGRRLRVRVREVDAGGERLCRRHRSR